MQILLIKTNYARTSLFRDYFFNRITIIWNGIPEDIKVTNILHFILSKANSNLFTLSNYIMFSMATMHVLLRLSVPCVAV